MSLFIKNQRNFGYTPIKMGYKSEKLQNALNYPYCKRGMF